MAWRILICTLQDDPAEYRVPDPRQTQKLYKGYFVTMGKKQADGKWKFATDTGTAPALVMHK